ncbi:MAG: hypothetical protein AB1585_16710 [Thermodesulfobacteriota bacterium]
MDTTANLKTYGQNLGADLIGVADLEPFRKKLPLIPENLIEFRSLPGIETRICGVCIAVCPYGKKGRI